MRDAHEIWAAAQLAPGEGIEDGVARIEALLALPAPAGEPEMPTLPEADLVDEYDRESWSEGEVRDYGDARAEHARRVERERCAGVFRYWLGGEDGGSYEGRCLAHINSGKADPRDLAAAPPQGEPK